MSVIRILLLAQKGRRVLYCLHLTCFSKQLHLRTCAEFSNYKCVKQYTAQPFLSFRLRGFTVLWNDKNTAETWIVSSVETICERPIFIFSSGTGIDHFWPRMLYVLMYWSTNIFSDVCGRRMEVSVTRYLMEIDDVSWTLSILKKKSYTYQYSK